MLRRLFHSLAMFSAILIAYQAYAWVVVPWVEPRLAVKKPQPVGSSPIFDRDPNASVSKYQRILAAYFPQEHWSQRRLPKVIENETGSVMFVLDDYQRQEDGHVDLTHFALLIFPTPRQQSLTPPRDAIILEAPNGARLQFDKNFRPERGQVGEIIRGEFPGKITIRSDMREPGPEDDLLVETTDLEMNSKLLFTPSDVRFRLGPNVGGGRELEIRLLEEETSKSRAGLRIASVDSLEIRRDVRLRLSLNAKSLLPGDKPKDEPSHVNPDHAAVDVDSPVEVTCTGPFHFDFIKYVASFDDNVEVWQVNPQGASDQLSCDQLDLHFARKQDSVASTVDGESAISSRQRDDLRWLEPDRIVAEGHPVVILSPSRGAEVRGTRVQLMLRSRQVMVEGGRDVAITYGPNVLRAPQIQYQHPPEDAATQLGNFRATGPGTLQYVPDLTKPDQVFHAEWQATVEMGRYNGQPVLTVAGRPRLAVAQMGQLTADQIRVYLREVDSGGKLQPIPDRMSAVGQVEIDSPELLAQTRELSAIFRVVDEAAPAASAGGGTFAEQFTIERSAGTPARTYKVESDTMQLEVALRGRRASPTTLACNGNVSFRELPNADANGKESFEVHGGQLAAENLDSNALVTIRGNAPGDDIATVGAKPAEIRARGMVAYAADVHMDIGQNRLWSDGPGVANMLLTRSLTGQENGTPTPVAMRWQGGLVFDGRTVVFRRKILVEAPDDTLQCDELATRLTSHVQFGKSVDQDAIDVAEIECRGNVTLDHKSRDTVGVTSHERMELARLTVNQQSGAITGDGPGVIRSTHFSEQLNALAGQTAPAATPVGSGGSKLQFLRVDFLEGLDGNLISREMKFRTRVRVIYGPVDAWEQELDANRPELLPPDTLTLTGDQLRINEDALAAASRPPEAGPAAGLPFGKIQFVAEGNVQIDGQSPQHGKFSATADRVSYEQVKELFILRGTDRTPATLWHQQHVGGQRIENAAREIKYNRLTGQYEQEGGRAIDFVPGTNGGFQINSAFGGAPRRQ